MKKSLILLLVPLMVLAAEPTVECCKLGTDLQWSGGKIYSGTVYKNSESVNCTEATPCDCTNKTLFPHGCRLIEGKTVGPFEAGVICEGGSPPDYKTNARGLICLLNGVNTVTNWIFVMVIVLVGIFILLGGLNIATAGGSPDKVTKGRNYIVYALIGFIVALLAKASLFIVSSLLGG